MTGADDPDSWPLVLADEEYEHWERFDGSLYEFLTELALGRFDASRFRDDYGWQGSGAPALPLAGVAGRDLLTYAGDVLICVNAGLVAASAEERPRSIAIEYALEPLIAFMENRDTDTIRAYGRNRWNVQIIKDPAMEAAIGFLRNMIAEVSQATSVGDASVAVAKVFNRDTGGSETWVTSHAFDLSSELRDNESFSSCFSFAGLKDEDGFGDLPGAAGAAA